MMTRRAWSILSVLLSLGVAAATNATLPSSQPSKAPSATQPSKDLPSSQPSKAPSATQPSSVPSGTQPSTAKDEAAERARFVGVWKGFTVEGKGERPDRGPVKLELIITERTMRGIQIQGGERVDHGMGEYALELSADPRHLDAAQTNERGRKRAYVGIYTLEGDTLRWCVSPQKARPETFETKKGQYLLILKKDRSADPKAR